MHKITKKHSLYACLMMGTASLLMACSDEDGNVNRTGSAGASAASTTQEVVQPSGDNAQAGAVYRVGEITVPDGFKISVFHEGVGRRARQLTVRDNGDVFVARIDGTLIALRDSDGDGKANQTQERKMAITTDVDIRDGWLYFSDRVSLNRVALDDNLMPAGDAETVISGFPAERQHAEKTFTFDDAGNIYVNIGAPANACQEEMRTKGSPGMLPCPILEKYAGIWKFNGNVSGQSPEDGALFVTGVRNAMALQWHSGGQGLLTAVHGRDQLSSLWPDFYTDAQSADLPAEELHLAKEGAHLGWPYTYYDPFKNARMKGPEYGGDGVATDEEGYSKPLHAFPAHWAPNDLVVVNRPGNPKGYREGAFIAFHGSWNRAPLPQAGYRVSFVPMSGGKVSGTPINFAVGFELKENIPSPGDAAHRPMGLAIGPNGDLFISDSVKGTIWRVTAGE